MCDGVFRETTPGQLDPGTLQRELGGEGSLGPAAPVRLAAIDIGTNSVRLLVVDALGTDDYRTVDDEKVTTRLGSGLASTGFLSEEAVQRTLEALKHLKAIAEARGATRIAAVATSAAREAANGEAFIGRLTSELGLAPRIISGPEEAELALLSVRHSFHLPNERVVCLDIGGGSLELVFTAGPVIQEVYTLPLGAIRLTEQFVKSDPISRSDWKALRRHIRGELKAALIDPGLSGTVLVGSGGTVSTLARVIANQRGEDLSRVHGYSTNRSQVKHAIDRFRTVSVDGRRGIAGVSADRAEIILAGATVVDEVLRHLGLNSMLVNEQGIREGLIMKMTRQIFGPPPAGPVADWRESVRSFAATCGLDRESSEHIASLAVMLFDLLSTRHGYGEEERKLVEAAAMLRNVGYHIGYGRHHIHSYHLIRHANLVGFSPREIEVIAQIARYHRRALPRKRHASFAKLARSDRRKVRRLAAIVRLVDGLDRSHQRRVHGIEGTVAKKRLNLTLLADEPVDLELWGGRQKKDLLEEAYKLVVTIDAEPRPETAPVFSRTAGESSPGPRSRPATEAKPGEPPPEAGDRARAESAPSGDSGR